MEQRETREGGQRVLAWTFTPEETVNILGPRLNAQVGRGRTLFDKLADQIAKAGYRGELAVFVYFPQLPDQRSEGHLEVRVTCAPDDPAGFPQLMGGNNAETSAQS